MNVSMKQAIQFKSLMLQQTN